MYFLLKINKLDKFIKGKKVVDKEFRLFR